MTRTYALAIGLATLLMTTTANAAPPDRDEVQAPRGQQIQPPRGQDVQAPRDRQDEVQAPRGQDEVQTPRGQNDVQVPGGTRSVEIDTSASGTTEGQASPPVGGDETPRCDDGTYNQAAGLCVSEGG